ncbi:MAG: PAS domain S-box protein [Chloroflexi bacterium]|nr:PAS domain S-box protein [Chloroflexota bacterium]
MTATDAWQRLTFPAPALRLTHQRQQARLLAALHLVWLVLALLDFLYHVATTAGFWQAHFTEFSAVLLVLAAAYALSRSRMYLLAAALDFGLGIIAILIHLGNLPLVYPEHIFYLMALGYLASIFLTPGAAITLVTGTLFLPDALALLRLDPLLAAAISFSLPAGVFALLIARQRHLPSESLRSEWLDYQQQFEFIADNTHDIIGRIAPDGRILYINQAVERMLGYPRSHFLGLSMQEWLKLVHPDDMERVRQQLQETAFLTTTTVMHYRCRHRDGHYVWIESISNPVRDTTGETGIIVVTRDVTDRVGAENRLRDSQAFLQSTLDAMPSHLAILDENGTIMAVNAAWRDFADANGFTAPDYGVGLNYISVCEASYLNGLEEARQVAEGIRRVIAGESSSYSHEYAASSPTSQQWFLTRVAPFPGQSEARVVVGHQNVTETRLAQEALEQALGMLQVSYDTLYRLIEQSPVGIQVFDTGGLCLNANSALLELFGVPDRNELIGHFNILTDAMSEAAGTRAGYLRALEGEMVHLPQVYFDFAQADPRYTTGMAGRRVFSVAFFPVYDQQNTIVNVVAMNQDVTQSRRAEQQRLELALERERVRLLRGFISDLSHDLRTPLATISTSVYLLSKATDDERRGHHAGVLQTQVRHMEQVLKHLLSLEHLESGSEDLALREVNLNELVEQVVSDHLAAAAARRQELIFQPDPNAIPLLADPSRLREAITNLLLNAISYTSDGGAITVRTIRQPEYACIEVQDTGIGISPADLPHIFDHFFRADKARSTDTGGIGLGLTITRRIVELHRGEITVNSAPGRGSTFRICLPG